MVKRTIRRSVKSVVGAGKVAAIGATALVGRVWPFAAHDPRSYQRDFSQVPSGPKEEGYLEPEEHLDADEETLFEDLKKSFVEDVKEGCGKRDPDYQDLHWGHTTGLLRGKLTLDRIGALPEQFRVGLFAETASGAPAEHDIICRPNFLFDDEPLIAISRLSIKVHTDALAENEYASGGKAHEVDLLLSEGLPPGGDEPDGQGFFFRDARQMMVASRMKPGADGPFKIMFNPRHAAVVKAWRAVFKRNTDKLYLEPQTRKGWAGKHYFSAGPYALGAGLMKFALEPKQNHDLGAALAVDLDNPAKEHKARFEPSDCKDGKIRFDLCIQIATYDSIREPEEGDPPKHVMATEYTDLAWDTSKARFKAVGAIELDIASKDGFAAKDKWWATPFNAWNTFEEMRPMGQLFRARRIVHSAHRAARLETSFDDADAVQNWTCPFSR